MVVLNHLDLIVQKEKLRDKINERTTCNMHPHNYYLEILTDLGTYWFFNFFMTY